MLGLVKCALGVMFVLVLVVDCSSISEECIRVNGVDYRGTQQKSSSGRLCLNWNNTSRNYDTTHNDADTGVGNHNFCRNPDGSEKLWCYVSGADGVVQRESCAVDSCQDQDSTEAAARPTTEPLSGTTDTTELVKSILVPAKGAIVQPVMGVSQRVRTGPKKKKDLGTLGYVLAIVMMAIIIVLGVGITVGYFYKRGRDLKRQHEQRVYEREMHRITLPLSAFANPTCELIDENAIVVSAESAEQMPPRGTGEGSDPLIGQAGTPGA
ncbi:phosphoinositide-3-kinase-interacting protein 1 [Trichomycterus rosablanca]|uniref:phosphoinositide-3-kinase-interacting protein 1 n=1 Tax=Trichomycterus rosablanca TaxID=2290929 RepID=UPI002F3585A3